MPESFKISGKFKGVSLGRDVVVTNNLLIDDDFHLGNQIKREDKEIIATLELYGS